MEINGIKETDMKSFIRIMRVGAISLAFLVFLLAWAGGQASAPADDEPTEEEKSERRAISSVSESLNNEQELRVGAVSHESRSYIVESEGDGYRLRYGESTLANYSSVTEITEVLSEGAHIWFSDISTHEQLTLSKPVVLSGSLRLTAAGISCEADVTLNGLELTLDIGSMRVKEGRVTISDSYITAYGESALVLDYSSGAVAEMLSGALYQRSPSPCVLVERGTLTVSGGSILSEYSYAVVNRATMELGGRSRIEGYSYAVSTDNPIRLAAAGTGFSGELSVKYESRFEKGSFTPVFYSGSTASVEGLTLYDETGEQIEFSYFTENRYTDDKCAYAVYLPYKASFYIGARKYMSMEYLSGEAFTAPDAPALEGYSFCGWYSDELCQNPYSFGSAQNGDIVLYGKFALLPPEFSLSSGSAVYDGEAHAFGFDSISHPLGESGSFLFEWFCNGEPVGAISREVFLKSVSDSGEYECRLTFSYGADTVSVNTPRVRFEILKKSLAAPQIAEKEYTGSLQHPDIARSHLYTSVCEGATDVGEYSVILTLSDYENYGWEGSSERELLLSFKIVKAKNRFLSPPTVKDGYEGIGAQFSAASCFGTPVYMFSESFDGPWSQTCPTRSGVYYFKVTVPESSNYYNLSSEAVSFRILEESVCGIAVGTLPNKLTYRAFETVNLDGAAFLAVYNSGRTEIISKEELRVIYPSGECLLVGDTTFKVDYGGYSIPVSVSVRRAVYDLSGIEFSDCTAVYDGKRHTASVFASITGLDGIPLGISVRGGGTDAGEYPLTLEFICTSPNYEPPEAQTVRLTVLPREIMAEYTDLSFVYDGTPKAPACFITLAEGVKLQLSLSGAATDAGIYTAAIEYTNPNYKILNSEIEYEIKKAELDLSGAVWLGDEFVYSGNAVIMTVSGLPLGVRAVGYANGSFTDAGEYRTEAILSYDTRNYSGPASLFHSWKISAAEYDFGDFRFEDSSFIYDGERHYPISTGELPCGADGSRPVYELFGGAVNVAEGKVRVEIRYFSHSKNYKAPKTQYAYVEILPMPISVVWENLVMTYNGGAQAPVASSGICAVSVRGFGTDAGEYIASAIPASSNYRIINSEMPFTIERCENKWLIPPGVSSYYCGAKPAPSGTSLFGRVEFFYYKDEALTVPTDIPKEAGEYYMVARVGEGKNYFGINSSAVRFEVIAVVPIGLRVDMNGYTPVAMSEIPTDKIRVFAVNNDGTSSPILSSDVKILYQSGNLPKVAHSYITVCALGFEKTVEISVSKAEYDLRGAFWEDCNQVYDGKMKYAYLSGLPEGVSVSGYRTNSAVAAGKYKLSAILSYDTENYNEPKIPEGWLTVEKQRVLLPELHSLEYNGRVQSPQYPKNPLYTTHVTEGVGAGWYKVTFCLKDSRNYSLVAPDGTSDKNGILESGFLIAKRALTLKVSENGKEFSIVRGSLVEGDALEVSYYTADGYVYLVADNPNYEITVIPAAESSDAGILPWIITCIALFLLALLSVGIFARRERLKKIALAVGERLALADNGAIGFLPEKSILATDCEHAETLISDESAKSLIHRSEIKIQTEGRCRAIVNIDTVSESFSEGDVVDINAMKEKGIIPKDAHSVKVLARGIIDKPLTVMANSFSLSAVKMIALTGGSAIKCKTERKKMKE